MRYELMSKFMKKLIIPKLIDSFAQASWKEFELFLFEEPCAAYNTELEL